MKPYQSAWDVAEYINKYPKKKVNINAITEYFKGGMERELKKITGSSIDDYERFQDVLAWSRELNTWLKCWYVWITGKHDPVFH